MIAVVILNWNGSEMLRRFLPSVVNFSETDDAVVYVADNGSTDNSVEMLCREFPTVHLILLEENYGFAEGYNRALKQLHEEYVVLLNSDVEVTPHWLTPLRNYLDTHPEVAACQPKLLSYTQRNCFEYAGAAGGYIDRFGYPFCRGRLMQCVEEDHGQYDTIAPIFWASGAALFIRRADFEAAGGFDARFFAHMEEIDLCWRLRARGRGIVCVPQSVVYHVGGATLRRENSHKTYLNFRNNLLMIYKNVSPSDLLYVLRMRRLLDYLAALSFLLKGQWSNALAVWQARREFGRLMPSFAIQRAENLRHSRFDFIPERAHFSLLVSYYLRFKRRFSQLKPIQL